MNLKFEASQILKAERRAFSIFSTVDNEWSFSMLQHKDLSCFHARLHKLQSPRLLEFDFFSYGNFSKKHFKECLNFFRHAVWRSWLKYSVVCSFWMKKILENAGSQVTRTRSNSREVSLSLLKSESCKVSIRIRTSLTSRSFFSNSSIYSKESSQASIKSSLSLKVNP
jgi:hypothetical protein